MVQVSRSGDIVIAVGNKDTGEWIRYDDKGKYRDYDSIQNWE
jgi:hypothetical protein